MRKINLENQGWYHVLNRGAGKLDVFKSDEDYMKFLRKVRELNNETTSSYRDYLFRKIRDGTQGEVIPDLGYPKSGMTNHILAKYLKELEKEEKIVEIFCYCFNPNHYHFILKQLTNDGIEKFMRRMGISYSKYFNKRYNNSGVLFQGRYKAFKIKDENQLARVSAYVNCNHEIHKLGKAEKWKFSSYQDYLNLRNGSLCNKSIVMELFKNDIKKYKEYCEFVIKDKQEVKKWEKMCE